MGVELATKTMEFAEMEEQQQCRLDWIGLDEDDFKGVMFLWWRRDVFHFDSVGDDSGKRKKSSKARLGWALRKALCGVKSCGPGEFVWPCSTERHEDRLGSGWNSSVRCMNSSVGFGPRVEQVAAGLHPGVANTVPIKEHETLGPDSRKAQALWQQIRVEVGPVMRKAQEKARAVRGEAGAVGLSRGLCGEELTN
ncbi:hypothetical protein F0562_032215 [Nyssa sinensis]|uniref:Uncharacterized protein n=1 Tax=Nyssa sinensis TaxID=561372 RepID=A0A5J5AWK8_9ASTE|nr:hypothetical protein F0562_032215 [Nyssa sinensis]